MNEKDIKFQDKLKKIFEDSLLKLFPKLPLLIICWGIGFYLLRQSSLRWSIDDEKTLTTQLAFIFLLSIFLILIPLVKSIKFLNIFELEREIKETKEEVKDFKIEIRQSFSMLTNSLNASIGNMNNNVTVHIPGVKQLRKANKTIEQKGQYKDDISLEEIKEKLSISDDEDTVMALAKTRIKIESLLREILNKRTDYPKEEKPMKFLGLTHLFKQFTSTNTDLKYLDSSFGYVLQICNAAIHGLNISSEQAKEALELGTRIIRELEYFKENGYR
jgi:hypothetical protein